MKKLIFTLTILILPLFSKQIPITTKIIDKIAIALTNKDKINIKIEDNKNLDLIKDSKYVKNVVSCSEADIILINKKNNHKCKNKIIFTTSYLAFKNTNDAIGAFFYQKGRPNIIFRKKQLEKYNINLPQEFDKYIE